MIKKIHSSCLITGLRPKTAMAERLAIMCVLPLLLSGILGAPAGHEQLSEYLRKLLVQNTMSEGSWSMYRTSELIDAVRFLWLVSFEIPSIIEDCCHSFE